MLLGVHGGVFGGSRQCECTTQPLIEIDTLGEIKCCGKGSGCIVTPGAWTRIALAMNMDNAWCAACMPCIYARRLLPGHMHGYAAVLRQTAATPRHASA